ncbi:hypothetical protein C0Q70_16246 [Pomacea canaliculata]|uniref:RB1-inducible coiled-coil protein 1 n=1 Tax=Pomacea canaliculata TaxID=400727 RepID=A0A2T7NPA6_POMCA|nr:hypothetical protein C0Q70_16246 [Pomacea canaliculata]
MLYVFLVDTGTMYTFDMKLTMEPVLKLKDVIAKICRIPVDKQVLLISGGEPLSPEKLVCSYSAGTDTNPIFLFGKSTIEGISPPSPSIYHGLAHKEDAILQKDWEVYTWQNIFDYKMHVLMKQPVEFQAAEMDLNSQVEGSLIMPATFDTVVSRTQLAMQIYEVDTEELKACERMVLDQHLQQQGWAAVVANLEDLVNAYFHRASLFQKEFKEFLQERDDVLALLRRIPEVLLLLERIPVLPCLECPHQSISSSHDVGGKHGSLSIVSLNLYTWINAQDGNNRLEDVIKNLTEGTELMTSGLEEKVSRELQEVGDFIRPMDMKDVKGLEERLYGLDQLMCTAGKLVDEQRHMAQGFVQNQTRVSDLKDHSILPDLCSSHKRQLIQMLNNHKRLHDIKRKCSAAKEELSANLHTRLRWVMFVQRSVNAMDNKLWLYHNNLDRIKGRTNLLKQVETSPQTYAAMVAEVARRRIFVRHYLRWAEETSNEAKRQHKREVQRRRSFTRQFGTHFLQKMVPGFKDHVPKFAAEPLKEFDEDLPSISQEDLNTLALAVPELKRWFKIPGDASCVEFTTSSQTRVATQSVVSEMQSITGSIEGPDVMGEMLFEHIDRDKLSLSDQAGLGLQQERLPLDDRLTLSLQEKFTVPESLSETLTAEVNSAAMSTITVSVVSASPQQQVVVTSQLAEGATRVVQEESGDGLLLSSGDHEPTKSSDSDAVSHESLSDRKARGKRRSKGLSDTSPDMETSQEFTTADFYIEDSMPSSMTDSPPKPGGQGKERTELSNTVAEKTRRMSELESEVNTLQVKLDASEDRLSRLYALACCNIGLLKTSVAELKETVQSNKSTTASAVSEVQQLALEACATLIKTMEQVKEQEHSSSEETIGNLQQQLELKSKHADELQLKLLKASAAFEDLSNELQQVREASHKEVADMKEKHDTEIQDIANKNLLEMELETDKVRTELQAEMDRQETEIIKLEEQLRMAELRLQKVIEEKECSSEEMMKNFVFQKEQIYQALKEEFSVTKQREQEEIIEKLGKEQKACLETLATDHQADLDTLSAKYQEKLDKVMKDTQEEKSSEIKQIVGEMEAAAEKRLQEVKEKLLSEHIADVQKHLDKASAEHREIVSGLLEEFAQERKQLKDNIQALKEPLGTEAGTQSEEGGVIAVEDHLQLVYMAEAKARDAAFVEYQQMLTSQRQTLEAKMKETELRHKKDTEDALSTMKTSLMAERQVQFNEAVSRVCQEKDRMIEDLKAEIRTLKVKVEEVDKESTSMDELRKQLARVKEKESELIRDNCRLEEQLQLRQSGNLPQAMTTSTAPLSSVVVTDSTQSLMHIGDVGQAEDSLAKPDWEQIASLREKKITELENKLMTMSMTASTRKEVRDKVSILQ